MIHYGVMKLIWYHGLLQHHVILLLQPIIYAFCRGLADSIKGTVTVFTLDKNIAAKANQQLTPQKEQTPAASRRRHREGTRKSSKIG